jgi:hypothetical protein
VAQDLEQDDVVLSFKTRSFSTPSPFRFLLSFEPFYRYLNQDTKLTASIPLNIGGPFPSAIYRNASATGNFYGAQLALEGSYPLSPGVTWIGRTSAGAYGLDAAGSFSDNFGVTNHITDSNQSGGIRLGAETGLRFSLSQCAWFSATASVDYFSDVPTAVLPRFTGDPAAHLGRDDLTIYKATGRLTFAIP